MAFTVEQLQAVEEALASGALTVKYADRSVTYRSQADLIALRDLIARSLGLIEPDNGRRLAGFSKGL